MSHKPSHPRDLNQCHALLDEQQHTLAEQARHIQHLQQQLQQLKARLFGRKTERADPAQGSLFDDLDEPAEPTSDKDDEPPPERVTPRRHRHGRGKLPSHLPRVRVEHTLAEGDRRCPCCGRPRVKMSERISEQLEYQPASFFVLEHARFTYACRSCEDSDTPVVSATKPPQPIAKGLAGPGLLATVIVHKFSDHLPLYRLEEVFSRHGVFLSRSTLCSWLAECGRLLGPLGQTMRSHLLQSRVIGTDDTPVSLRRDTGQMKKKLALDLRGRCRPPLHRVRLDHPSIA